MLASPSPGSGPRNVQYRLLHKAPFAHVYLGRLATAVGLPPSVAGHVVNGKFVDKVKAFRCITKGLGLEC